MINELVFLLHVVFWTVFGLSQLVLVPSSVAVAAQGTWRDGDRYYWMQMVNLLAAIIGVFVCAYLAYGKKAVKSADGKWHWPHWAWLWDNQEDGVMPAWYVSQNLTWSPAKVQFHWTALRNSVNNFRYLRGVSQVGWPLFYRTWTLFGKQFYFKCGWLSDGYPCWSIGAGMGY